VKNTITAVLCAALFLVRDPVAARDFPAGDEPGVLTLTMAVELALSRNPELAAVAFDRRIAEADRRQASLIPNPELETELENIAGSGVLSGFDATETTLAVTRAIETAGKRRKRVAIAANKGTLAQWDEDTARLEVTTETRLAFIDCLTMQRRVALAEELYALARRVETSVGARVEAGRVSPLEATKAGIAVANARMALRRFQERLSAAKLMLAGLWGEDHFAYSAVAGDLEAMPGLVPRKAIDELLHLSPEVARMSAELDLRRALLAADEAERVPDVTVKLGYKHISELDEGAWLVGFSVPLPLFDRNQGKIRGSSLRVSRAEAVRKAVENRTRVALLEGIQSLETAYAQATTAREEILPAAASAYEGTREAYREGKLGYLDVLDAQRTYFEASVQYVEWLARYHRRHIELARLVGGALPTITAEKEADHD